MSAARQESTGLRRVIVPLVALVCREGHITRPPTRTPGQFQSWVEEQVRRLQMCVCDASYVPGVWSGLSIISAYGQNRVGIYLKTVFIPD